MIVKRAQRGTDETPVKIDNLVQTDLFEWHGFYYMIIEQTYQSDFIYAVGLLSGTVTAFPKNEYVFQLVQVENLEVEYKKENDND